MTVVRWLGGVVCLVAMGILVGLQFPAAYAQGTKLEWKAFEKDKTFYQELTTDTTQDMKVMNQEIRQKQNQKFLIKWTGLAEEKDMWVVEQQIDGVKMNINIGGNEISYDSTTDQPKNPMTDFFEKLTSMKLKLYIKKDLSVDKIEGRDEFISKLGGANPQMAPLLKAILSEDALKQMAEPTWGAFAADMETKKTWDRTSKLDLGPIGSYNTKYEFAYKGSDKNQDKIAITAAMTYAAPPKADKDKNALPFKIKEGDSTKLSGKGSGEALFNRDKGRFDSSSLKMELNGSLVIDVAGMETTVELKQTQDTSFKTYDTKPTEWEKKKKSS